MARQTLACSLLGAFLLALVLQVFSLPVSIILPPFGFMNPTRTLPAPMYTAELAPPKIRGMMVGMNGINISIGYALPVYVALGFFHVDNQTAQWRAPLGLALFFPLLMIGVCFVVPESPRYLLLRDRAEEARDIVLKLHGGHGDAGHDFAHLEFSQMAEQAIEDRQNQPCWVRLFLYTQVSRASGNVG